MTDDREELAGRDELQLLLTNVSPHTRPGMPSSFRRQADAVLASGWLARRDAATRAAALQEAADAITDWLRLWHAGDRDDFERPYPVPDPRNWLRRRAAVLESTEETT